MKAFPAEKTTDNIFTDDEENWENSFIFVDTFADSGWVSNNDLIYHTC